MNRAPLPRAFFERRTAVVARALIGCFLESTLGGERCVGRIVETEAYLGVRDTSSHTYGGRRTERVASMWARPGTLYVYFTYGMHFCMNISAGSEGVPVAVLLRAIEPTEGLDNSPSALSPEVRVASPAGCCAALSIGSGGRGGRRRQTGPRC